MAQGGGGGAPLRELLAVFGFDFDRRFAQQATRDIASVVGATQQLAAAFMGSALVAGATAFVQNMIDVGSELADASAQMGVSATELAEWRFAARLAGVEASQLQGALARISVLAQRGGGGVFRRLGVEVRDANGALRGASDILEDVGVAIGELDNETERTAIATQVFGRSGRALIPLFRGGRNGIRELRAEVRRLYGTDLDRLAAQADEAGDAQDRLNLIWDALRTRLALSVLPVVTSALETMVELGGAFVEAARASSIMQAAALVLGAVLVGVALSTIAAWGPPVALFLIIAAGVAAIVLIVDDLITLFRGGRSVVGEFIDELFGAGTAADMVARVGRSVGEVFEFWSGVFADIRAGWIAFWEEDVPAAIARVTSALGELAAFWGGVAGALGLGGGAPGAGTTAEPGAVTAAPSGGGPVTVTRTTSVGAINVTGAADPVATARAVRAELATAGDGDADGAVADLVPEAP